MSTWSRLEYDRCPTCGAAALIETERLTTGPDSEPRVRITRVECTCEECLHSSRPCNPSDPCCVEGHLPSVGNGQSGRHASGCPWGPAPGRMQACCQMG